MKSRRCIPTLFGTVLIALASSSSAIADDTETFTVQVDPISLREIAAEFVDTCVKSYPSEEALVSALAASRFAYEEVEPTSGGLKLNWSAPFGWVGLTEQVGGPAAAFTPQCEFNAFASETIDSDQLDSVIEGELTAHFGPDNVTRIDDRWRVRFADGSEVIVDKVSRGGPNQAILIVVPIDSLTARP